MATIVNRQAADTDVEAQLSAALAQSEREKTAAQGELAELRAVLTDAHEARDLLQDRVAELEGELGRARTVASIRRRLLADIRESRPWRRGATLRRAARVEQLLDR